MSDAIPIIFDTLTLELARLRAKCFDLEKRCDLLERVFKKLMEFDSRLDTLEFNSNQPVKPAISEKLLELHLNVENIKEFLKLKESTDV